MSNVIIPNMMLQIGDQFDRFQIRSHIAQGSMADIYRAYDLTGGKDVVLKIPNDAMLGDPAQSERFQRELEVTNTLDHPAIQKGLGSGNYNRTPYLITAYVDGQSMRDFVVKQAPLPPERALALMRKIADGVAYCHEHAVVHRDLKPENVLITADDQPVILDFGQALTKSAHRVTYANLTPAAGTPDYMSPEQIEGQRGDRRSDIYALGTMLYELLSGRTPLSGDNRDVVMRQHLQGAIPRLDQVQPGVSLQLAAIVARCLQRNADDRYPTARALIDDLDHPEQVDTSVLDVAAPVQIQPSSAPSSTLRMVGIGLVAVIVLVIIALALHGTP